MIPTKNKLTTPSGAHKDTELISGNEDLKNSLMMALSTDIISLPRWRERRSRDQGALGATASSFRETHCVQLLHS